MSLLACTGKLKKKIQKFAIVEVFRTKIPPKTEKIQEIKEIDKFASQLAKPNVSIQKIKSLAWYGIPNCKKYLLFRYKTENLEVFATIWANKWRGRTNE